MEKNTVLALVVTCLLGINQGCEYSDSAVFTSTNSRGQAVETMSDQHLSDDTCMFLDTDSGLVRLELGSDQQVKQGSTITVICKLSGEDLKRFPWYLYIEEPSGAFRNEPIMTTKEWEQASSYAGVFKFHHTITCNSYGTYHLAMTVGSTPFRRADIRAN